jgi:DNA-binding Lrp family transcriptional regulator
MDSALDELDRRILHELCTGIYSYDQLAQACSVTRNTIYRRVNKMEKLHFISKMIMAIPDFAKLGLSAICIGMDVPYQNADKVIDMIKMHPDAKFLWRTYGEHQIMVVMVCGKGCEGGAIEKLKQVLAKFDLAKMHISIGFAWEKIEFSPF